MWNGMIGLFLKMEQNNLYNEINFNLRDHATRRIRRRSAGRSTDSSARRIAAPTTVQNSPERRPLARAVGLSRKHGGRPGRSRRAPTAARRIDPTNPLCFVYDNGLTYQNSAVNMADITDGTSTTVIFGESLTPTGVWALATSCCVRTNIDRTINKPILYNGLNYYTYWMSKHPSMVNFAFCDGSVRPGDPADQQDRLEQDHDSQPAARPSRPTRSSDRWAIIARRRRVAGRLRFRRTHLIPCCGLRAGLPHACQLALAERS